MVVVNIPMRRLVTTLATSAIVVLPVVSASGCELTQNKTPPLAPSSIKQEILHTTPLEGSGPFQVVTSILTLASGASTGRHIHHGLESGYILNGEVGLINDDQPPRYFSAGDSFVTYRDLPHTVTNPGTAPSIILVTWTVDSGNPTTQTFG
jgi:quercetin dioxygenase-like cupin family protein